MNPFLVTLVGSRRDARQISISRSALSAATGAVMRTLPLAGCEVGLLLCSIHPAVAQQAAAADQLQEVIVTAQKRAENVQDVGIAIAAYSADNLKAAGVTNLVDLARYTPGLGLAGSFAGQNSSISIRGVTQQDFNAISEGPNAVYIDEGYVGINNVSSVGLFDIDRVEVLKGPQGTLFGRNATGGVLNIVSGQPSSTFGGYANYTVGSYNTNRVEAAVTGPLYGDTVTARLAMFYDHNGAYVTNLAPTGGDLGGTTNWGIRSKIDFKVSSELDVLLTGFMTRWTSSWGPYFSLPETPVYAGSGATRHQIDTVPSAVSTIYPANTSNPDELTLNAHDAQSTGDFQNMEGGDMRATYDVAGWSFTSITDYKHFRSKLLLDDTALPVSYFDTNDNAGFQSFSEELRSYRDFGSLRLTTGIYALNMHTRMDPGYQIIEPALGGPAYFQGFAILNTNAYAGFGQLEWDLDSKWTLIGGARYTDDQKHYTYVQYVCGDLAFCGNVFYPAQDLSRSDGLITGKGEIEYHAADGVLLYTAYNRGAKSGGFNFPLSSTSPTAQPPSTLPYKPEKLDAYDAGFKIDALSHSLQINGDAFYYNYKDFQSFILLPPLTTFLRNNPAKTSGGELTITSKPVAALTTSLAIDYVHNRVSDVNIADASGNPVLYTKEAPFTSPWQANAMARYEWPLFNGSLGLQADAKYIGEYFFSLTNYTAVRQPGFMLYDANLSWVSQSGHWSVGLTGTNLGDKRYKTVGFDVAALFGEEQVAYGQPRWFKAQLGWRF
jgi:iron complex outermembrane receptor protein